MGRDLADRHPFLIAQVKYLLCGPRQSPDHPVDQGNIFCAYHFRPDGVYNFRLPPRDFQVTVFQSFPAPVEIETAIFCGDKQEALQGANRFKNRPAIPKLYKSFLDNILGQ